MQEVIVILIFALALGYIIRLLYNHFTSSSGCPKGCGSCSTIDIEKIKDQLDRQASQV